MPGVNGTSAPTVRHTMFDMSRHYPGYVRWPNLLEMKLDVLSEAGIISGPGFYSRDLSKKVGPYTFEPVFERGTGNIWYYEHKSPLFLSKTYEATEVPDAFHTDDKFAHEDADYMATADAKLYAEQVVAMIPKNRKSEIDLLWKAPGTYYASIKLYPL